MGTRPGRATSTWASSIAVTLTCVILYMAFVLRHVTDVPVGDDYDLLGSVTRLVTASSS